MSVDDIRNYMIEPELDLYRKAFKKYKERVESEKDKKPVDVFCDIVKEVDDASKVSVELATKCWREHGKGKIGEGLNTFCIMLRKLVLITEGKTVNDESVFDKMFSRTARLEDMQPLDLVKLRDELSQAKKSGEGTRKQIVNTTAKLRIERSNSRTSSRMGSVTKRIVKTPQQTPGTPTQRAESQSKSPVHQVHQTSNDSEYVKECVAKLEGLTAKMENQLSSFIAEATALQKKQEEKFDSILGNMQILKDDHKKLMTAFEKLDAKQDRNELDETHITLRNIETTVNSIQSNILQSNHAKPQTQTKNRCINDSDEDEEENWGGVF